MKHPQPYCHIRPVRRDELQFLSRMDVEVFGADGFDTPEDWNSLKTFFILHGRVRVGSIAVRHHTTVASSCDDDYRRCPGSLYLASIAILPNWQRQGIAEWALRWLDTYARSHGFTRIVSNVRASNHASIALHHKAGFRTVRLIANWYDAPTEATVVFRWRPSIARFDCPVFAQRDGRRMMATWT